MKTIKKSMATTRYKRLPSLHKSVASFVNGLLKGAQTAAGNASRTLNSPSRTTSTTSYTMVPGGYNAAAALQSRNAAVAVANGIQPTLASGFDPNDSRAAYQNGGLSYGPASAFTTGEDPYGSYTNIFNTNIPDNNPAPPLPAAVVNYGGVFSQFAAGDVIENQQEIVTKGLWTGNVASLLSFYTSSSETATQKQYYYEIYNSASSGATSEPQFSVAYGNRNGSGSLIVGGGGNNDTVSRAIYSQYKLLLLEPGDTTFTINGTNTDQIYVININRARFRESLDPGNMQLNLAELTGKNYANNVFTGSNVAVSSSGKYITLIDDSNVNSTPSVGAAGRRYNLVSGSLDAGIYNASAPHYYGLVYPQLGIVILNANTLNLSASFNSVTGSNTNGDNAYKLYTSISGAALITDAYGEKLGFEARSSENVKSAHYFVRVKNAEYNFSNNPSFVTGSDGDFSQPTFAKDPQVYITSVGLYNAAGEMLAVAKMSKPLLKSFTREALIKVKLQF